MNIICNTLKHKLTVNSFVSSFSKPSSDKNPVYQRGIFLIKIYSKFAVPTGFEPVPPTWQAGDCSHSTIGPNICHLSDPDKNKLFSYICFRAINRHMNFSTEKHRRCRFSLLFSFTVSITLLYAPMTSITCLPLQSLSTVNSVFP